MFGRYLLGTAELALIVAAAGFAATGLRRALLAGWSGAPARLAEAVLAVAMVVTAMEALGVLGLLYAGPLVGAVGLAGGGAGIWARRHQGLGGPPPPPAPPPGAVALGVAVAVGLLVAASWGVHAHFSLDHGIYGEDSTQYHMPHAARFAADGSITALQIGDPFGAPWFHPSNSELLHAGGIVVFGNDFLSVLLNMFWLGLALLAAWCVGRPYGAGPAALVGAAVVLQSRMFTAHPNPGSAKNDIVVVALILAAAALLINGERRRGATLVAALAAGLALGTKITAIAPVIVLTVCVIASAPRAERRVTTALWLPAMLVTGGFWYLRNLIAAGSPFPLAQIGIGPLKLPAAHLFIGGFQPPYTVVDYLTDGRVWHAFLAPGLRFELGPLWWAVVGAALAAAAVSIAHGRETIHRALGVVVLASFVAYVFTPLTAYGLKGFPVGFVVGVRYAAPAIALGLALLPVLPGLDGARARWAPLALFGALFATERPFSLLHGAGYPAAAIALALLVIAVPAGLALLVRRGGGGRVIAACAAAALLAVGLGWSAQRDYLRGRYRDPPGIYGLNPTIAWAQTVRYSRIAVIGSRGSAAQYPLYGPDLSNVVDYVGLRGPHGGFLPIEDCATWRRALNAGRYEYLVASPFLFLGRHTRAGLQVEPRLELGWTLADTGARVLERGGGFTIVRLGVPLDPAGCRKAPDRA